MEEIESITVDGKEYKLAELSEHARQIFALHAGAEIAMQEAQRDLALHEIAKETLKNELCIEVKNHKPTPAIVTDFRKTE
ncbi:MAG: DUF6447 family protein [Luminiphilus sp.]|nr:DUF6447 family protein [Luminiphilus sp.]